NDSQSFADIWNYINHKKAVEIIQGILLSVVVAFSVGAIVQFISRIIYTFNFAKRKNIYKCFIWWFCNYCNYLLYHYKRNERYTLVC
ncbi:hypothetical protein PL371_12780, partial [Tenacibaculum maritimum]